MHKDTYIFPGVFIFKESGGIGIYFPDLDGCVSSGDNEWQAHQNAKEALCLHLYGMETDKEAIPAPSNIKDIHLDANECLMLIEVYMPAFRAKQENKFVKKTLTLPHWLNVEAEQAGVNFSQLLQASLKEHLKIKSH